MKIISPMPIVTAIFAAMLVVSAIIPNKDNSKEIKAITRQMDRIEMQMQIEREKEQPIVAVDDVIVSMPEQNTQNHVENMIPCYTHGIDFITEEEFNLLCRVVQSEASIEPFDCQVGVCETILNRLVIGGYGNTIAEIVRYPQYSTAWNGEPTESVTMAVTCALEQQMFPSDMVYFRADYYHDFGEPYAHIGTTYFSLKGEE